MCGLLILPVLVCFLVDLEELLDPTNFWRLLFLDLVAVLLLVWFVPLFGGFTHSCIFFSRKRKALRFDALIDKEEFMYKSEHGRNTPYNSTQGKGKN
jgi:hypothetical protein